MPCTISEDGEILKLKVSTIEYIWDNLRIKNVLIPWHVHTCLLYTSPMTPISVIKPAAFQLHHSQQSGLRSLLFLHLSFSCRIVGFFLLLWEVVVCMGKKKSLVESQKIGLVEKAECEGRHLDLESSWNGIQDLTLKKTIVHVVLSTYEALLSTTRSALFSLRVSYFCLITQWIFKMTEKSNRKICYATKNWTILSLGTVCPKCRQLGHTLFSPPHSVLFECLNCKGSLFCEVFIDHIYWPPAACDG